MSNICIKLILVSIEFLFYRDVAHFNPVMSCFHYFLLQTVLHYIKLLSLLNVDLLQFLESPKCAFAGPELFFLYTLTSLHIE